MNTHTLQSLTLDELHAMKDAIDITKSAYETARGTFGCAFCELYRQDDCVKCPHVVIDNSIGNFRSDPCWRNPKIPSRYRKVPFGSIRMHKDASIAEDNDMDVEAVAATRKAHIRRMNRWLEVVNTEIERRKA